MFNRRKRLLAREEKEVTFFDNIVKENNVKEVKAKMIEEFKASLLSPERVNFIDYPEDLKNMRYDGFYGPDQDGGMTCTLLMKTNNADSYKNWNKDDHTYNSCNAVVHLIFKETGATKEFKIADVYAIPSVYCDNYEVGKYMSVGLIHSASISGKPYRIIYSLHLE